jgi:hypothetical protein
MAVAIEGGKDAPALQEIAEKPDLGAPAKTIPRIRPRQRVVDENEGAPAALFSGAGSVVADGQSGHVLALVVVMAMLTAAAVVAAVRGARR